MDKLLKQKPTQMADERKELFALMDRFAGSIAGYRKQYASIVERKNADLKQRGLDRQNALHKLAELQKSEQSAALKNFNDRLSSLNQQIAARQNQAAAAIQSEEEQLAKKERQERSYLDQCREEEDERLGGYRNVRNQIASVCSRLDLYLGENLHGESKLKKIGEEMDQNIQFSSVDEAVLAVAAGREEEALGACRTVEELMEFLPSKIFSRSRRMELIQKILRMNQEAQAAVVLLEGNFIKEQYNRKEQSDRRCQQFRSACQKKKQEIMTSREADVKGMKEEILRAQRAYQDASARMKADYKTKSESQAAHYDAQAAGAEKKWNEELHKCSKTFAASMEAEYPAANMNAWLRQFWMHPARVEQYDRFPGMQMNTMIGMAAVDISGWLKGETGPVIRKVLGSYPYLFGTNKEQAKKSYQEGRICLPYTISVEEGTSVHISYGDGEDERVKTILNAVGMRLLRSVPACMMRFQLFDANGIGAFGRLMSLDPARFNNPSEPIVKSMAIGDGGKVYSSQKEIAEQIAEAKINMDDLARQLTNYLSIREFNAKNPLSRQIYRPILMMNFPMGLEELEIRTLNAMTMDCSRWGFSMILAQPDKAVASIRPEVRAAVQELSKNVLCLRLENQAKFLRVRNTDSMTERSARIALFGLPDGDAMDKIAAKIREQSVEASRMLIRFAEAKGICPEPKEYYTEKADDGIVIPVGYLEGGQPFRLQFDDKHVHTIIMGNTGSGKTNLLHVMMTNLMLRYPPQEVMIYLIDFKFGLDFRIYTQYNLPNFRTISVNNDPEFALAMLQNLENEQKERSSRMGSRYQKISEYNAANPGNRMNRILLVVDELYELVKKASDDVQKSILKKLDSFAHQTRAFGIHMVVSGQDLDKIDNFTTIKNQCTTRLALHCGDEQVKELMGDEGAARMHTIDSTDQGACVFSSSGGTNPQIEHTAYMGANQQEQFLKEIHKHYLAKRQITGVRVLLTKVSDNPNHLFQMFVTNGSIPDLAGNLFLTGEPISMDRELNFRPSGNVWVVGGSTGEEALEAGVSFLFFGLLSMLLRKLGKEDQILFCTNCADHPMRSVEEEETDRFGQMASHFPELFTYSTCDEMGDALSSLLKELDRRRDGMSSANRPVWWFLARPELVQGLGDQSQQIIDLRELLQEGPKYGIHVVVWNADPKQAQQLQLDRHLFQDRVCLEMTAEECKAVNGSELKPMPEGCKAVLIGKHTMRFRIYDLPDGKWMEALFDRLLSLSGRK